MENRNIIKNFGYVSRMDNVQAAFLNYKLKNLNKLIKKEDVMQKFILKFRQKKCFYSQGRKNEFNTYHTFVVQVRSRDKLKKFLLKKGIHLHQYIILFQFTYSPHQNSWL